jgi:DNA invertase Pin-like site-specific DNA recombinase
MITTTYTENASGADSERPQLRRLLSEALDGDVLLVESVDRLSRLPQPEWEMLRAEIKTKGVRVVAVDLPTSHQAMSPKAPGQKQGLSDWMLSAINEMMLDMAAAIARKDYNQRRQRQAQGIEKAKSKGLYQGRPRNEVKRKKIAELLTSAQWSTRKISGTVGCSTSTVQSVRAELRGAGLLHP